MFLQGPRHLNGPGAKCYADCLMNGRTSTLLLSLALAQSCTDERVYGALADDAGARNPASSDGSVGPSRGDATKDRNTGDAGIAVQTVTIEVGADASTSPEIPDSDASVTAPTGSVQDPENSSAWVSDESGARTTTHGSAASGEASTSEGNVSVTPPTATDDSTTSDSVSSGVSPSEPDPSECDLVNGSFEEAARNPGSGVSLSSGSDILTGWSVVEGSVLYSEGLWEYADGRRGLDLNGGSPGGVEQVVATVKGQGYVVRFALAGNPDRSTSDAQASPVVKGIQVWAGDHSQTFTFDVTGRDAKNMGWVDREFTFNATSDKTELRFRSITDSSYWGPAIDDIRLYGCGPSKLSK